MPFFDEMHNIRQKAIFSGCNTRLKYSILVVLIKKLLTIYE